MVDRISDLPTERKEASYAGNYGDRINSISPTREFSVCPHAVRVRGEYLDVRRRREVGIRQLHCERVGLKRQISAGEVGPRIVDRTANTASHLVTERGNAAWIVGFDVDSVAHFDALVMTARVVESGVTDAKLVDHRHRVDLCRRLNVDGDAGSCRPLSQ